MHGIGQGNGGGPPIWAVISSNLLDTLRSKGFGLQLMSPITQSPLSFVGYSFVDDMDIVQSDGSTIYNTVKKTTRGGGYVGRWAESNRGGTKSRKILLVLSCFYLDRWVMDIYTCHINTIDSIYERYRWSA
jgi:hypothetical protein